MAWSSKRKGTLVWSLMLVALGGVACGGEEQHGVDDGGTTSAGGAGGIVSGGGSAGAEDDGGAGPAAGAPSGGRSTGGFTSGGGALGGGQSGGATTGGATTGGMEPGGSESAGAEPGGAPSGGAPAGGAAPGGTAPAGAGGAEGGAPAGGGSLPGGGPAAGAGGVPGEGGAAGSGAMMGCYVAVRIDDCCSQPVAADALAPADPCLVPYEDRYQQESLEDCPAAESCLMLGCTYFEPASRVVIRDESGTCVFSDECDPAEITCQIATDHNQCCSCPEVFPQVIVDSDPCVVAGAPPPGACADCSAVDCPPCSNEPLVPACGYYGSPPLARCVAAVR